MFRMLMIKEAILFCCLSAVIGVKLKEGVHVIRISPFVEACTKVVYLPGGEKIAIEPIKSKKAELESSFLGTLLGHGDTSSNIATNTLGFADEHFQKFSSYAGKIATTLGMFGIASGFIGNALNPSDDDILEAVNKAVKQLTDDVNNRLDLMKGYLDQGIINLEKDLLTREYKHMFNLFALCIKQVVEADVNDCMRTANDYAAAGIDKILIFHDVINDWSNTNYPTNTQIKRIEVNIISFRDYATLRIATLQTLIETYKTTKLTPEISKKYFERYTKDLKKAAALFVNYADKAKFWTIKGHKYWKTDDTCKAAAKCGDIKHIYEGTIIPVWTFNFIYCGCHIDPMIHKDKKYLCEAKISIRKDGRSKVADTKLFIMKSHDDKKIAKAYFLKKVEKTAKEYGRKLKIGITNYLDENLMNVVTVWKKYM